MLTSTNLTPMERVHKAHVMLMNHAKWCAFGPLLACGSVRIDPACRTAYTNGWDVVYGEAFIASLPLEEVRGVALHEAYHKAYRHLHIYKNLSEIDHRLANIAADHFVNLSISDEDGGEGFVRIPAVGIKPDPRFRGMSVEQIFKILMEEGKGKGKGEKDKQDGQPGEPGEGSMDEHDWEAADKAGADSQEIERQAREIERAVRQGEHIRRQRGKGAGSSDGVFGDLLNPKIDWRVVLRQFVTSHCASRTHSTWRKPNRRHLSGADTYLPSLDGKTVKHLVVGFDTSGSCFGGEDMTRLVTELQAIVATVKPRLVTVVYCDWVVQGTAEFKDGRFSVQSVNPVGGGGTDLTKIFGWLSEQRIKPSAAVILTDGYTPFGTAPGYPVLWAMTTDVVAPYGVSIKL